MKHTRQFVVRLRSEGGQFYNYFAYELERQLTTARLLHKIDLGHENCVLIFEELEHPQTVVQAA